jgi:spermidine synthase
MGWIEIDAAETPEGGRMVLRHADGIWEIRVNGWELMSNRAHRSEEALAELGCARLAGTPRILIGGLGMGFTLRAALAALGSEARITVAELVPAVVAWARGPMAEVYGNCLSDPRVTIRETDVGELIGSARSLDAILLDVDNGPAGLAREANDALYGRQGLAAARAALGAGGVLAIWSSGPDPDFTRALRDSGFDVDEVRARANAARGGARHVIWIATRASGPS